jgi:hypothetical protein
LRTKLLLERMIKMKAVIDVEESIIPTFLK